MRAARAVHQRAVAWRVHVRMQGLQRVHQHAGDVVALAQHAQRVLVHVLQRIGVRRRDGIADSGLHVLPPAVVGAAEADQVRTPRVIAREAHRLHHRLGAGHVERNLVQPGNFAQATRVVRDRGMVGAQNCAQRGRARTTFGHAFLVERLVNCRSDMPARASAVSAAVRAYRARYNSDSRAMPTRRCAAISLGAPSARKKRTSS